MDDQASSSIMDAAVPIATLPVPLQAAEPSTPVDDQANAEVNKDDDLLSERFVKEMELPVKVEASSSEPTSLHTFVFDEGFEIDVISRRERKKKEVDEQEEDTDQEGDNASTVVIDEDGADSQADSELDALCDEIDAREAAAQVAPKLEVIAEEVHVNEDAEEHYDGAAGLWGQNYQLPCFNKGAVPKYQPRAQTVQYQTSSRLDQNPFIGLLANQTIGNSLDRRCKPPTTLEQMVKAADEAVVFTKTPSDCQFCMRPIEIGRGVVLKGCLHTFCRHCIIFAIENTENAVMGCPSKLVRCSGEVRDEEIKALLSPDAYDKYTTEQLYRMNVVDFTELIQEYEFVENKNDFRCDVCMEDCKPGEGVTLKSCLHQYCKNCIGKYIEGAGEAEIPCPWRDDDGLRCIGMISEMEIRSLIPLDSYRRFLDISLATAEAATPSAYHCKTPNCKYWVEIDPDVVNFQCGLCLRENCVKCKAVHHGISCQDYYEITHGDDRRARENAATENQVQGLLQAKRAQNCPRCGILVQRFDGCRHMTCSKCKHEFQWTGVDLNEA